MITIIDVLLSIFLLMPKSVILSLLHEVVSVGQTQKMSQQTSSDSYTQNIYGLLQALGKCGGLWTLILKYLVSHIISKGKCISLFLSAEDLGNSTWVMIKHNFLF
jgi:hypothetical protein